MTQKETYENKDRRQQQESCINWVIKCVEEVINWPTASWPVGITLSQIKVKSNGKSRKRSN